MLTLFLGSKTFACNVLLRQTGWRATSLHPSPSPEKKLSIWKRKVLPTINPPMKKATTMSTIFIISFRRALPLEIFRLLMICRCADKTRQSVTCTRRLRFSTIYCPNAYCFNQRSELVRNRASWYQYCTSYGFDCFGYSVPRAYFSSGPFAFDQQVQINEYNIVLLRRITTLDQVVQRWKTKKQLQFSMGSEHGI